MSTYYTDDTVTLHEGNCMTVLPTLPTGSVDCIVTSPPYFGLRDYGHPDQHGLEESPAQYVETMRSVFAECRRVLADDGTLWLNLGDSYYSGRGNPGPNAADTKQPARRGWVRPVDRPGQAWAAPKNLLGIPWRVAFALQDDGWILRNAIVWHKLNRMPESVRDRLATAHEHVFLFSKSRRYFFNLDAIREDRKYEFPPRGGNKHASHRGYARYGGNAMSMTVTGTYQTAGRNPGDVWTIPTSPFPEAHYAVMAPAVARRCLLAGCKPGGAVLDPYHGAGTTGMVAGQLGLRYVGIELSRDNLALSLRTRMAQAAMADGGEAS